MFTKVKFDAEDDDDDNNVYAERQTDKRSEMN